MQPESSDGFASVGTILPEERAALLPGGSFRFCRHVRPRIPRKAPARQWPHLWRALRETGATIQSDEQAEVAQLVEQLIRNQQVVGSSPTFGSTSFPPAADVPVRAISLPVSFGIQRA